MVDALPHAPQSSRNIEWILLECFVMFDEYCFIKKYSTFSFLPVGISDNLACGPSLFVDQYLLVKIVFRKPVGNISSSPFVSIFVLPASLLVSYPYSLSSMSVSLLISL